MRAAVGAAALTLLTVTGIVALADATKFTGEVQRGGTTRVVFRVDAKNYHHHLDDAAASLWYACVGSVNWHASTMPRAVAERDYEATLGPALGEDSRRRFRGCLEDATVDKVRGDVRLMETVGAAPDD